MHERIRKWGLFAVTIAWAFFVPGSMGRETIALGGAVSFADYLGACFSGVLEFVAVVSSPFANIKQILGSSHPYQWIILVVPFLLVIYTILNNILIWKSDQIKGHIISFMILVMLTLTCDAAFVLTKPQQGLSDVVDLMLVMAGRSALMVAPLGWVVSGMMKPRSWKVRGLFTANMALALGLWITVSLAIYGPGD